MITPTINYLIPDTEWIRTADLRRQEDVFPLYHGFFGTISFRIDGREVLGSGKFNMSIADLAVGLAEIFPSLCADSPSEVLKFQQSDDMLEILFSIEGDRIKVTHNLAPALSWICDCQGLRNAVREFIESFTAEAAARVPDLFSWRHMGILRNFSNKPTEI